MKTLQNEVIRTLRTLPDNVRLEYIYNFTEGGQVKNKDAAVRYLTQQIDEEIYQLKLQKTRLKMAEFYEGHPTAS